TPEGWLPLTVVLTTPARARPSPRSERRRILSVSCAYSPSVTAHGCMHLVLFAMAKPAPPTPPEASDHPRPRRCIACPGTCRSSAPRWWPLEERSATVSCRCPYPAL